MKYSAVLAKTRNTISVTHDAIATTTNATGAPNPLISAPPMRFPSVLPRELAVENMLCIDEEYSAELVLVLRVTRTLFSMQAFDTPGKKENTDQSEVRFKLLTKEVTFCFFFVGLGLIAVQCCWFKLRRIFYTPTDKCCIIVMIVVYN